MSEHLAVIELKKLIQSEIGDFIAGFGQPGEPTTPEEMQTKLQANIDRCFAEVERKWFLFPSKDLVWMTRSEFAHYCYINKMKPVNLDYLRDFADQQREIAKDIMRKNFDAGDEETQEFFRQDAIEWALLSRGLTREIKKLGGL
ncbi:hypothetical protein [Shewanella sp. SM74]|uniref:hypothetical protein n=1 Tax=Shewanella sp. SM74 TaxID=2912807 RepID=UPI0021D95CE4|nr:hypothetical protein [Shewanella sp. SM74]MCU8013658.1 hypothetical protein [Shewanella sp. SM74]